MDVTRHQFLAALHNLLQPDVYLEIGVQYGSSLVLADRARVAIGIDPNPLLFSVPNHQLPNQQIHAVTSDEFFQWVSWTDGMPQPPALEPIDLAFIDGSHLVEDVMCDFVNVQRHMKPGGVIVFDDVLPYNQAIAAREQPPGDWTGDVWKSYGILNYMYECGYITNRPILVNTWPTGTMVLPNVEPSLSLPAKFSSKEDMRTWYAENDPVPDFMIDRTEAVHPDVVLEAIRDRMA